MSSRSLGLAREISRGYDGLPDQAKELSPQHEEVHRVAQAKTSLDCHLQVANAIRARASHQLHALFTLLLQKDIGKSYTVLRSRIR